MKLNYRTTTPVYKPTSRAALALFAGLVMAGCNPDPESMRKYNANGVQDLKDRTEQMVTDAYVQAQPPVKQAASPARFDPDQILRYPNATLLPGSTPTKKLYRTTDDVALVLDHYRSVLADVDPQRSGLGDIEETDEELDGDHVTVITAAGTRERGWAYRLEISRVMGSVTIKVTSARRSDSTASRTLQPGTG